MAIFFVVPGSLLAQTSTWDGEGGDTLWSTSANWDGDAVVVSGDTVNIGGGTNLETINDQVANFSLGALNFLNSLTGNASISGNNVLNLDGTLDVASVGASTLTHTINNDLRIDALRVFDINGDETLNIAGNMTSDDGLDDIRKTGTGTLLLTGTNNDAANGIDIIQARAGSVQFKAASNLGKGRVHLGQTTSSGTLEFVGDTGVAVTFGNQIRSVSNVAVAQIILANGATSNDTINFSNFNNNGNGNGDTLVLGGDNTGNNLISGNLSQVANAGLTKQGAGIWVLSAAQAYAGDTTVSSGRLEIQSTATTSITVADGATLGGGGNTTGNLTLGSGGSNLVFDSSRGAFEVADLNVQTTTGNHTVFVEGVDPTGVTNILTFSGTLTSSADVNDDFVLDGSVVVSDRGATFGNTSGGGGGNITLDLGFKSLTWDNGAGNLTWDNASVLGAGNASQNWSGTDEFFNGDSVSFGDTGIGTVALANDATVGTAEFAHTSGTYQIDGPGTLTINSGGGVSVSGAGDLTLNANLTGGGSVSVSGGGTLSLGGDNSFSGNTTATGGSRIEVNSATALGTGSVSIGDTGSTLAFTGTTKTVSNDITIAEAQNAKTIISVLDGSGTALNLTGNLTLLEQRTSRNIFDTGDDFVTLSNGTVSGIAGIEKRGSGTLKLTNDTNSFGNNSDTLADFMSARVGTIEVTSIANQGVNSAAGIVRKFRLGRSGTSAELSYVGTGNISTDRVIETGFAGVTGSGGAKISNNGTGSLTWTAAALIEANDADVARTLTLGGNNTEANEIQGAITDNTSNAINLVKEDEGNWIVSGTNTYTGTTTVSGGNLVVNGSTAAASTVTVNSGAGLSGNGTIGGSLSVSSGAFHAAGSSADSGSVASQTVSGNADYAAGSSLVWDLVRSADVDTNSGVAGTDFDQWNVAGNVDFASGTLVTLDFNGTGSSVLWSDNFWGSNQSWVLANVTGTLTDNGIAINTENWLDSGGNAFNTAVGGSSPIGSFALDTSGGNLVLNFTTAIPEPSTYALLGLLLGALGWVARRRRRATQD